MSRWFRHYAGMMRDEKLVSAAMRSKQPIERVVWIWGAILESSAEINDDGKYNLDTAEVAYFLRTDEADVQSILDSLSQLGRLHDGRVAKWSDRQFKSDRSAERVRAHRDRNRDAGDAGNGSIDVTTGGCNADVTLQKRHGNSPETETEKKDAAPNGAHPENQNDEADLYRRGKQVLGKNAGGVISNLLKAKSGSVPLARAAVEQAATKENAREYIARVIAGPARAGPVMMQNGQPYPDGII